ncbi:MAG: Gfo/Idh/MocA family oxidoreductase [Saprospiraceae bacterium]|uniref:Gfo/Idh/MocA family oxidoreductase n=1 Tax=Candidatus Opimibacter skivensis TaxID=2982028 RepID=A0A9D7XP48_9BACT|nr:Gfo/Idh/MocA family oxidoreductase [Candidatus Opimibacter skivensis]
MITFGLIGYGKIGERHAGYISAHPDGRLKGAFDTKKERSDLFAQNFPSDKVYSSLAEILNDEAIDIVSICTPNYTHAEITIAALQAGKHVLVEKPMAIKKSDCESMIHTSLKTGKSLFVVKQNRFNPPVQAVKKLLDHKKLGKIYSIAINCYWNRNENYYRNSDWKGKKDLDGGTLFTQFSHFIDVVYYLMGDMHILNAQLTNAAHQGLIEFEDTGVVTFLLNEYNAPGVLHYTTAAFRQNMEGSITIFAEHATIKIGGKYLNTIDYQATDGFDIHDIPLSGAPNQYGDYEGSMSNHDQVINNVIRSLQGKTEIMTNAYDGLKSVEIIENIYQIARTNGIQPR